MVSLDTLTGQERETTEEVFQNYKSKSPQGTNHEPVTTNGNAQKRSQSSRRNSLDPNQSSLLKLSHLATSGVDSRNLKKAHTKIVFFDHASPKPAATSMLLYTTDDQDENDKESPLKSIPNDDGEMIKIEDV